MVNGFMPQIKIQSRSPFYPLLDCLLGQDCVSNQTRQSTWFLFVWRSRTQIWDGLTCWQSRSLGGPGGYLSAERTPDTKTQSCLTPALLTSIALVHQNRLEWSRVDVHLLLTRHSFFWWRHSTKSVQQQSLESLAWEVRAPGTNDGDIKSENPKLRVDFPRQGWTHCSPLGPTPSLESGTAISGLILLFQLG